MYLYGTEPISIDGVYYEVTEGHDNSSNGFHFVSGLKRDVEKGARRDSEIGG
jgi:hypothetical protein